MHATQPQTEQPGTVTAEDDDERFRPQNSQSQPAPDETAAFKPIFEPGSVFDRVSKGGLAKQEQTIEVDGLTSDDAKRTDDFTVQFQMARHPELLPFLAMNHPYTMTCTRGWAHWATKTSMRLWHTIRDMRNTARQ